MTFPQGPAENRWRRSGQESSFPDAVGYRESNAELASMGVPRSLAQYLRPVAIKAHGSRNQHLLRFLYRFLKLRVSVRIERSHGEPKGPCRVISHEGFFGADQFYEERQRLFGGKDLKDRDCR
jgi:hypothetical protein